MAYTRGKRLVNFPGGLFLCSTDNHRWVDLLAMSLKQHPWLSWELSDFTLLVSSYK
jgi:hypothetical protein